MKIFTKENFENKRVLVLGDSVSAKATIGFENDTYSDLLAKHFKVAYLDNEAIGGTTATYTHPLSNVYKEYKDNKEAIDACQVVDKMIAENRLDNFDVLIIYYGHNDKYFQAPIGNVNDKVESLDDCTSFIASYKYAINKIKEHNKDIKIIFLNCTYSEYWVHDRCPYYVGLDYDDYRKAIKDLASYYHAFYVDPWDELKKYFDVPGKCYYYKDVVHLSPKGHEVLYNFLLTK